MKNEKKRMKKAACLLLCMMLSCGAASAEVPAAQTTNAVTVYQGTHTDSSDAKMFSFLNFTSVSINKGCSKRLPKAIWMTGTRISYSSSDNKVVSVNSKGVIRGNKTGKAVITIKVMRGTKVTYVKVRVSVCEGHVKGRR